MCILFSSTVMLPLSRSKVSFRVHCSSPKGVNADVLQHEHGHDRGGGNLKAYCQNLKTVTLHLVPKMLPTHVYTMQANVYKLAL